jgi:hypothetical protein
MSGILNVFQNPGYYFSNPVFLIGVAFQIWMLIHAARNGEWFWFLFMFIFPFINPILYYFLVYRNSQPLNAPTFELPGAGVRRRIKELQGQIHHLDKAHHHAQLADIYFSQGKLKLAEDSYKASLERDPTDIDARAHYGQCLFRLGRPKEALPFLQKVVEENPQHEYGQSMMMYAESLTALGEKDAAIAAWRKVLERHTYSQARVQYAQLLLEKGEKEQARHELHEVITDAGHVPAFQKRRERAWVKQAKSLLKKIK